MAQGRNFGQSRSGGALGSYELMARRDNIIAGGMVRNDGVQVDSVGWNESAVSLVKNSQLAFQAVCIPAAVTARNAAPSIGVCKVDQVEGSFFISNPSAGGQYIFGMGMYISKLDGRTGTFGIRYPLSPEEGAKDDWLQLRVACVYIPADASLSDSEMIEFPISLPHPVLLCGGEALHVCIQNSNVSAGNCDVRPFMRSRVADVA